MMFHVFSKFGGGGLGVGGFGGVALALPLVGVVIGIEFDSTLTLTGLVGVEVD